MMKMVTFSKKGDLCQPLQTVYKLTFKAWVSNPWLKVSISMAHKVSAEQNRNSSS